MRRLLYIVLMIAAALNAVAQDYTFSNHNVVPFSLNPSLVGNANAIRLGANYRMQWPSLGNRYHTVRLSYDQNFYKRMCSLGLSYAHDNMANGTIKTNEVAAVYGHTIRLFEGYFLRLGAQASFFYNKYGSDVMFGDQYDWSTGEIFPNTTEEVANASTSFVDFSAGAAFVIENKLTLGAAVYHLGEPENGIHDEQQSILNHRYVVHANYLFDLQYANGLWGRQDLSDKYAFVNAAYQSQYNFDQLYAGVGVIISPLIAGVSMKSDLENINVFSFMLGATYKALQAYYIYDLFTSDEKNGSWSHEISLIYIIQKKERYPCPVVYW